jgi:hypothetical protein
LSGLTELQPCALATEEQKKPKTGISFEVVTEMGLLTRRNFILSVEIVLEI